MDQDREEIALLKALLLPRVIEEKMLRLIRQGRLSKWFSGYGQEAIAVGTVWALRDEDYILPLHRNLGVWTTRGLPLDRLFAQLMGKEGGYTQGRDRTFHFGETAKKIIGMISHLGAMLPVACGLALGEQLSARQGVAVAFSGEGGSREGDFHEALNLAAIWNLPVIFIVENNQYGLSTPTHDVFRGRNFSAAATGYGMAGRTVDGNDVRKVIEAVGEAAERARSGHGPTLLEMKTFRMRGHEEASGTWYVPEALMEAWSRKDPVERYVRWLIKQELCSIEQVGKLKSTLKDHIETLAEQALALDTVSSTKTKELQEVYAPSTPTADAPKAYVAQPPEMTEELFPDLKMRFIDGISAGLHAMMTRDPKVVLMGQDIAEYGGVFKVTKGFVEDFGKERVRNTPIIESGALGAGLGLALNGYRPVIEMQYADFISCGFNQIVNNLATTHYRWGHPVNVTIRAPFGGGIGAGPFHSQSMEAWFAHVPGLKVVVPATPFDAKGLLIASICDPNPVLFFEHKYLYRSLTGVVPEEYYEVPLGKAHLVRPGKDATIVTYGVGVRWALEEASFQETAGIELEVIDLRTITPWDRETVLDSLARTNRVLFLHEAPRNAGFAAELCAEIVEEGFHHLDAPPVRVTGLDMPVPFSKNLEDEIYSAQTRLRPALSRLLSY